MGVSKRTRNRQPLPRTENDKKQWERNGAHAYAILISFSSALVAIFNPFPFVLILNGTLHGPSLSLSR